jgi:hypothetical protein
VRPINHPIHWDWGHLFRSGIHSIGSHGYKRLEKMTSARPKNQRLFSTLKWNVTLAIWRSGYQNSFKGPEWSILDTRHLPSFTSTQHHEHQSNLADGSKEGALLVYLRSTGTGCLYTPMYIRYLWIDWWGCTVAKRLENLINTPYKLMELLIDTTVACL